VLFPGLLLLQELTLAVKSWEGLQVCFPLLLALSRLAVEGKQRILSSLQILAGFGNLFCLMELPLFFFVLTLVSYGGSTSLSTFPLRILGCLGSRVFACCCLNLLSTNHEPSFLIATSESPLALQCGLILLLKLSCSLGSSGLGSSCLGSRWLRHEWVFSVLVQVREVVIILDVDMLLLPATKEQVLLRYSLLTPVHLDCCFWSS